MRQQPAITLLAVALFLGSVAGCRRVEPAETSASGMTSPLWSPFSTSSGTSRAHARLGAPPGSAGAKGAKPEPSRAVVLFDRLDQATLGGLAARVAAGEVPESRTRVFALHFEEQRLRWLRERLTGRNPGKGKRGRKVHAQIRKGKRAYRGGSLRLLRADGREARAVTPLLRTEPGHAYALTYRMAVYGYRDKKQTYQRKPRVGQPILEVFDLSGLSEEAVERLEASPRALQAYRVPAAEPLNPPGMERNIPWMALGDTFRPGSRATHFRITFAVTGVPLRKGQQVSAEVWYDDIVLEDLAGPPAISHRIAGAPGYRGDHPLQVEVTGGHLKRPAATEKRQAIYAPAPSSIAYALEVPPGAVLRFGHGFLPEFAPSESPPAGGRGSNKASKPALGPGEAGGQAGQRRGGAADDLERAGKAPPVSFAVTITDEDGGEETVYRWELPDEPPKNVWVDAAVDLTAYAGRRVRLALETRGRAPEDMGLSRALSRRPEGGMVWSFPVLDTPETPGRTVVLVVWDTVPAKATSLARSRTPLTPRLVDLASRGVTFDRALATSSWTLPSFATILTGTHPVVHDAGELDPQTPRGKRPLPESVVTLASRLRKAGWETRGWINNPYLMHHFGLDRGFSSYIDYDAREAYQASEKAVEQAVAYLSTPRGYDRFVFFHFMDTHGPYLPHAEYRERYARIFPRGKVLGVSLGQLYRKVLMGKLHLNDRQKQGYRELYDAVLAYTDHQTGRLYDAVAGNGGGAGLFIVTADHGEEFWEHGYYEHGHTMYDELLHVPLVITHTGSPRHDDGRPRHVPRPVSLEDLAPTIEAFAGLDGPDRAASPDSGSVSLLPVLSGEPPPPHRSFLGLFTLYGFQRLALERDDWKLIYNQQGMGRASLRTGPFVTPLELYDVAADPGETNNLVGVHPNLTTALLEALALRYLDAQRGRLVLLYVGDAREQRADNLTFTVRFDNGSRWKRGVHDLVWPSRGAADGKFEVAYQQTRGRSVVRCTVAGWKALLAFEPAVGGGPARVEVSPASADVTFEIIGADGRRRRVAHGPEVVTPVPFAGPLSSLLEEDVRDHTNRRPRLIVLYDAPRSEQRALGEDTSALEEQLKALGYVE